MIFDSDVLIWAFRDNQKANQLLLDAENICISACTANGKHYKCVPDLQMDLFKVD